MSGVVIRHFVLIETKALIFRHTAVVGRGVGGKIPITSPVKVGSIGAHSEDNESKDEGFHC